MHSAFTIDEYIITAKLLFHKKYLVSKRCTCAIKPKGLFNIFDVKYNIQKSL